MNTLHKRLIAFMLAVLLASSFIVVFALTYDPIHFTLGNVSGRAGDTVTVALSVSNNTAGFSGLEFTLTYDERYLEIVSIDKLDTGDNNFDSGLIAFNNSFAPDTVKVVYAGAEDNTYNGNLFRFTFLIKAAPSVALDSVLALEIGCLSDVNGVLSVLPEITNGTATIAPNTPVVSLPTLTGRVQSYNPKNSTTVQLLQNGAVQYETIMPAATGVEQVEQPFTFHNVNPGTYSLVITKPGHTKFTVQTVVVGEQDLDLTQDSRPDVRLMTLRCGDIDGDGLINGGDLTVLWMADNYNRSVSQAANPLCDLNGDGLVNGGDLTILWMADHYNRGPVVIP